MCGPLFSICARSSDSYQDEFRTIWSNDACLGTPENRFLITYRPCGASIVLNECYSLLATTDRFSSLIQGAEITTLAEVALPHEQGRLRGRSSAGAQPTPAPGNIMSKIHIRILVTVLLAVVNSVASAQTSPFQTTLVTVENYNRAQTDVNFAGVVKNGGFGKFRHGRELAPPAQQGIVRPNRDTLYSFAIVDLDAGPVTITLPDVGKRFMGMQVVNQDQYTPATYYGAGTHTLTREMVGTRYAIVGVRIFVDFSNEEDVRQVHALQDEIRFSQNSPGTFEVPQWDEASLKKVQAALQQLGTTLSDTRHMFGANEKEVDPVKHLIGSAMRYIYDVEF